MKLSDKIIKLRKDNGWSQEELAEKLNVSRQAISRWENDTALPDAQNILLISKLFNVTTDYLLNDVTIVENVIPNSNKKYFVTAIIFGIATVVLLIGFFIGLVKFSGLIGLVCIILIGFAMGFCAIYSIVSFIKYRNCKNCHKLL